MICIDVFPLDDSLFRSSLNVSKENLITVKKENNELLSLY